MSHYREDDDIKAEFPDIDPELVRRAEFWGYTGNTIMALQHMETLAPTPEMHGDVQTWFHDFGKGRIFRWGKRPDPGNTSDGRSGTGALWQVVPLPNGDMLMGFRDATESILYPKLEYARLSDLDYFIWEAGDATEPYQDLLTVPDSWRHRFDPIEPKEDEK